MCPHSLVRGLLMPAASVPLLIPVLGNFESAVPSRDRQACAVKVDHPTPTGSGDVRAAASQPRAPMFWATKPQRFRPSPSFLSLRTLPRADGQQ